MTATVGKDIESLCSKCGDVWHVVVAKVGETIVKVQCKECGAYHRHRPPGGKGKAAASPRRRTAAKGGGRGQTAVARIPTPEVEPDLSRPVRGYGLDQTYEPADRIEHPTFGVGVVQAVLGPGKIDVFFSEGRRVLAQAKPQGRLERPPRFDLGET
jgi:hypothetical protein